MKKLLLLTLILSLACSEDEFDPASTGTVVVQGYLFAGAPIPNISVTQLIPFLSDEDSNYVIKDASILLIDDLLTTGATASETASVLKRAGARTVGILTLAITD